MTVEFLRISIDVKEKWDIAVLGKISEEKKGFCLQERGGAEKWEMLESRPLFLVG